MKNILFALIAILGATQTLKAQNISTTEFHVHGNCEMCKTRIEKATKSVDGTAAAFWNIQTGNIKIVYNSEKAKEIDFHKAISNMGYKTTLLPADSVGYKSLPDCCQVESACSPIKKK